MAEQRTPSYTDQDFDPTFTSIDKFRLYETKAKFYIIGSDRSEQFFRVLKIDRSEHLELKIDEGSVVYSHEEIKNLIHTINEGNRATGGVSLVAKAYGIAGCIKFLESYYLILIMKRRQVGSICGHAIYSIVESQMIAVLHPSQQTDVSHSKTELRYKKLLSSVDLTKDFFYSYTYPLMQSLQKNILAPNGEKIPYDNMFVWNDFLTKPFWSSCHSERWTVALIHGYFKQVKLSILGREFSLVLIARRSRHFAGTRYLKRGVNDLGKVANDVEIEQIVLDEETGSCGGTMSSVVQMRGSIPLFWSQEASKFSPKPDIILQRYDPTYEATKLHFEDVAKRYGNPIIILNLIKTFEKRPREMMLRREFANAVGYLNQILGEENQLKFIHWDFQKFAKSKSANVLAVLGGVASEALDLTGFYFSGKPMFSKRRSNQLSRARNERFLALRSSRTSSGDLARLASTEKLDLLVIQSCPREINEQRFASSGPRFQSGVLRTNCIDCLDRTNVAQYAYGLAALGRQLHAMGLANVSDVNPSSSIAVFLMDMYENMGDALAHQYGGSAAHNVVFPERQGKWKATTQSREFLKSIKRYYSNTYTDGEKQDAINLFLGYFEPKEGKPELWELDSDYYLHVSAVGDKPNQDSDERTLAEGIGAKLKPVSACKQDFSRVKFTSLDKLLEKTCCSIKNVRLSSEFEVKASGMSGNLGMSPDAAEIQLKSPNWLFGHKKYQETISVVKAEVTESTKWRLEDDCCAVAYDDLNCLCCADDTSEEDIFKRYIGTASVNGGGDSSWYGGTLIFDQDENSEAYKHYAEFCQGPIMDPFEHDPGKEKCYADAVRMGLDTVDDSLIEAEMETALKEYDQIGSNLGIFASSCKGTAEDDPNLVTRWILGEDACRVE